MGRRKKLHKVCVNCGEENTNKRSRCNPCYAEYRRLGMKASSCHPEKQEYAQGLCRPCFRTSFRDGTKPTCHPDKPFAAKGLCRRCYANQESQVEKRRLYNRRTKYKLSKEEYETLLNEQEGACAICKEEPSVVDHDHRSGKVRGLLCLRCNTGLGMFRDSTTTLNSAINYLMRNQELREREIVRTERKAA